MRSFRLWKTWFLFGTFITFHLGCKDKNNYPKPKSDKEINSNSVNEDQHEDESFTYSDSMIQEISHVEEAVDINTIDPNALFDRLFSKAELYTSNNFDIKSQADTTSYLALTKEEKIYIIGTRLMGKLEGQIDTTLVILNQSAESHFGPSIELVKYYPSTKEFSKKLLSVEYLSENFE